MTTARRTTSAPKRRRLDVRVTDEQKARLEHAAALRGLTLSGLIVEGALREAERAIGEHERITLSAGASRAFVEALLIPRAPAPRLLEAIEQYKAEFGRQAT